MGNRLGTDYVPSPVVLVPPLFDFPPPEARFRMLKSSYDVLFGKLARKSLFENYFDVSSQLMTTIMLKPLDDPTVDFITKLQTPSGRNAGIDGDAIFRWQPNIKGAYTFMDMRISGLENAMWLRSCGFYPKYGLGTFTILPLLKKDRINIEDFGTVGIRYGSNNLSVGMTTKPITPAVLPASLWMVGKIGSITAGCQYKSPGEKEMSPLCNLENWSFGVDYSIGQRGALYPSFTFGLEYCNNSKIIASFYQHLVVQRKVKNPFEGEDVVGVTNYVDVGFEIHSRMDKKDTESNIQAAISWQANRNMLLKAKIGTLVSGVAMALKCWWQPSVAFIITFLKDHLNGESKCGFGIHVDNLRQASYETAHPDYVMFLPTKEQKLEGTFWKTRPYFQTKEQKLEGTFWKTRPYLSEEECGESGAGVEEIDFAYKDIL